MFFLIYIIFFNCNLKKYVLCCQGVFVAPGLVFSPALMRSTNFPQSFVYGTYRVRLFLTKNNEAYGCVIFVCEVKRLWEAE